MTKELKDRILSNSFVDKVRTNMEFDEAQYIHLCSSLHDLSNEWKHSTAIDKELAYVLYSIPQMIRNSFLSFPPDEPLPKIAHQLEDAWVELDALVQRCFSSF